MCNHNSLEREKFLDLFWLIGKYIGVISSAIFCKSLSSYIIISPINSTSTPTAWIIENGGKINPHSRPVGVMASSPC